MKSSLFGKLAWQKFSSSYWKKKPVLVKKAKSELLDLSEKDLFELLVKYADHCLQKGIAGGFKFYIDGQRQPVEDLSDYLPFAEDQDLRGYHHRMETQFDDYCLVCDDLIRVMDTGGPDSIWHKLSRFMHELYSYVGMPNRFAEIGLYLGNYRKTPFGVHVDKCCVFSFPVIGEKTFRLWNPEYVHQNPDLQEAHFYKNHLKASEVMQVGVGDASYWPSSYWHIAEGDGKFSCTWSIGVWTDRPYQDLLMQTLGALLENSKLQTTSLKSGRQSFMPPNEVDIAIEAFEGLDSDQLRETLLKDFLLRRSKNGFKDLPFARKMKPLDGTEIVHRQNIPKLLWLETKNVKMLEVAVRGQFLSLPSTKSARQLLTELNQGQEILTQIYFANSKKFKSEISFLQALRKLNEIFLTAPSSKPKPKAQQPFQTVVSAKLTR